jgi:predicted outer membrane repeat protein
LFDGNKASNRGGALYINGADGIVSNCVFKRNSCKGNSSSICNHSENLIISNSTFTGNKSSSVGGNIWNFESSTKIINCILWNNGIEFKNEDYSPEVSYCVVSGGFPGEENMDIDPHFVNALEDLSLRADSPCIDAGIDTSDEAMGSVTADFYGNIRPQNNSYDIGAYEFLEQTMEISTSSDHTTDDNSDISTEDPLGVNYVYIAFIAIMVGIIAFFGGYFVKGKQNK